MKRITPTLVGGTAAEVRPKVAALREAQMNASAKANNDGGWSAGEGAGTPLHTVNSLQDQIEALLNSAEAAVLGSRGSSVAASQETTVRGAYVNPATGVVSTRHDAIIRDIVDATLPMKGVEVDWSSDAPVLDLQVCLTNTDCVDIVDRLHSEGYVEAIKVVKLQVYQQQRRKDALKTGLRNGAAAGETAGLEGLQAPYRSAYEAAKAVEVRRRVGNEAEWSQTAASVSRDVSKELGSMSGAYPELECVDALATFKIEGNLMEFDASGFAAALARCMRLPLENVVIDNVAMGSVVVSVTVKTDATGIMRLKSLLPGDDLGGSRLVDLQVHVDGETDDVGKEPARRELGAADIQRMVQTSIADYMKAPWPARGGDGDVDGAASQVSGHSALSAAVTETVSAAIGSLAPALAGAMQEAKASFPMEVESLEVSGADRPFPDKVVSFVLNNVSGFSQHSSEILGVVKRVVGMLPTYGSQLVPKP